LYTEYNFRNNKSRGGNDRIWIDAEASVEKPKE
jgi:hypothetical protein